MTVRYLQRLCLTLSLLLVQSSFAEEALQELLVVRPDGSWPPHEMYVNGELTGFHIELVQKVASTIPLKLKFESLPWKRAIEMLKKGDADAITYMGKTSEREAFGYFYDGNVISKATVGFFIEKKYLNNIQFSGELSSLMPYSIGTVLGFSYQEEFDQMTSLNKINIAENEENLLKMLLAGRMQMAIGHVGDIGYHAKRIGVANQVIFLKPYLTEGREHYIVFAKAKGHDQLAKTFSEAMKAFKSTPEYLALQQKYGLDEK
ncbi:hypothetical protein TW85_11640 [Marinomonas sp. S3726]|uniref:substrate-binding periplasmic protein n=1 Tax=Marinomonas sp. S3726 TaxID=579484 RepID=UPI0005FA7857|nr:transporter substrate-binding domain-containing protein [Marinomonas sp. S3726]KJZ13843.1 hypothetical protein TW85_11640 [Marinomonas sp. S3726]